MPGHVATDHREIGVAGARLVDDLAVEHHDQPVGELSGGNVQRTVLARELAGEVDILVAANPCFGLDFAAVAQIHAEIMAARNRGAAVLVLRKPRGNLP